MLEIQDSLFLSDNFRLLFYLLSCYTVFSLYNISLKAVKKDRKQEKENKKQNAEREMREKEKETEGKENSLERVEV